MKYNGGGPHSYCTPYLPGVIAPNSYVGNPGNPESNWPYVFEYGILYGQPPTEHTTLGNWSKWRYHDTICEGGSGGIFWLVF